MSLNFERNFDRFNSQTERETARQGYRYTTLFSSTDNI